MLSFCQLANKNHGLHLSLADIKSHKVVGSVPLTPQEIFSLQDLAWQSWQGISLVEEDCPAVMNSLESIGHKVWIATSRPRRSTKYVEMWLKKQGLATYDFYPLGPYRSKSSLSCDALVDDAPEQIRECVRTGKIGLLYTRPWNADVNISGAIRVETLSDIEGSIE